jgi:hypothetical protein
VKLFFSTGENVLSDRSITAATVLDADALVRGRGATRGVRRLERCEPELASYLMKTSTRLYGELDRACPSHVDVRSIHRDAVLLALACIEAVRRSA